MTNFTNYRIKNLVFITLLTLPFWATNLLLASEITGTSDYSSINNSPDRIKSLKNHLNSDFGHRGDSVSNSSQSTLNGLAINSDILANTSNPPSFTPLFPTANYPKPDNNFFLKMFIILGIAELSTLIYSSYQVRSIKTN